MITDLWLKRDNDTNIDRDWHEKAAVVLSHYENDRQILTTNNFDEVEEIWDDPETYGRENAGKQKGRHGETSTEGS